MSSQSFFLEARKEAVEWARRMIATPADQWVILDTETTGLHSTDQVIQIAVIDGAGNVLINNQLIRPSVNISMEAQEVHRICMDDLKDAPNIADYLETLSAAIKGKIVVIYNTDFDLRILRQSVTANCIDKGAINLFEFDIKPQCAMVVYSKFVGEWNRRFGNFRWQRLPSGAHDALGDCRATYELIKRMAEELV